jgi:NAD(P)-dependent dehydrogenase (short-subunit alcohol dehydrogenase family)
MEIAGKTVIVTGAGGDGSGRAIARRFARGGALVVADDIDVRGAQETVGLIAAEGGQAIVSRTDVRSEEAVREMIVFAERTFGPLAVLVNNASAKYHPDEPLEYWRETIETDLLGIVYATRYAIEAMRRSGLGGAIVNIGSISALPFGGESASDVPAYDAAKAGVMRLTTGLADLAASDRIRVNCLTPGWIASVDPRTYWESLTPQERAARGVPSRMLSLDEVADMVLRLATDEALFGRVVVWQSEDVPRLIPPGDRGYASLDPL